MITREKTLYLFHVDNKTAAIEVHLVEDLSDEERKALDASLADWARAARLCSDCYKKELCELHSCPDIEPHHIGHATESIGFAADPCINEG